MSQAKRQVPPMLKAILQKDIELTKKLVICASQKLNFTKCKKYFKGLEISCHGIPWFAFWICFTWLFNDPSLIQMQVNILLGLLVDIILVALLKAITRRRRPVANKDDALGQIGPDVFSFPSGHASRAAFVAYFFLNLHPAPVIFFPILIIWATAVCISRIFMNRHHLLDVVAGVLLGLFVGVIVGFLYVEEDTARWIMNYLSDEKLDGGEYHV